MTSFYYAPSNLTGTGHGEEETTPAQYIFMFMLYNCIWERGLRELLFSESSRRSQANTHQGKTF